MEKAGLRREMLARREALSNREARGTIIETRLYQIDQFRAATLLASYVGVGAEVPTIPMLQSLFRRGVTVAVPWVGGGELCLTLIQSMDQLTAAPFGLLEPLLSLKEDLARQIDPAIVQLFLVPGLAFDRQGGRLGHGKGYYDRLLIRAGPAPLRIALAFDAQVVDRVPMTHRDQPMDVLVTEETVYRISARTASAAP